MNNDKKIGILIEYGFHDIKKFIHSGLAQSLALKHRIVWFVLDKKNQQLHDFLATVDSDIVFIQEMDLIDQSDKIDAFNHSIRRHWMLNYDLGVFHNHRYIGKKSYKTKLLGNHFLKSIFERITLLNGRQKKATPIIEKLLNDYGINSLLCCGYASMFVQNMIWTSAKSNVTTYCIINSWKDLYVNNFIPFTTFKKIFVWDEQMKSAYLQHMPYLNEQTIVVTGNPSFDYILQSESKYSRSYYAEKYRLPLEAKWLYYTMMPPSLVADELETIKYVAQLIKDWFRKEEVFILVRRNPNHRKEDFLTAILPDNMVLTDHYCEFDSVRDMLVQSAEGEQEWIDLLHYSFANLSVPSTVTKEFMLLGKPVLNIEFNKFGVKDTRIEQFFEAGYYRYLFDERTIFRIINSSQLLAAINIISNECMSYELIDIPLASNFIVKEIQE